jgi:hypothetical protein
VNPETLRGEWLVEEPVTEAGQDIRFRQTCNPYQAINDFGSQVKRASFTACQAREAAALAIDKLAGELRRTDCPTFARVEECAVYHGVDPSTVNTVWAMAVPENRGHARATHVKTAGVVDFTEREMHLAQLMVTADDQIKLAVEAMSAGQILEDALVDLEKDLEKVAAAASGAPKGGDTQSALITGMSDAKSQLKDLGGLATMPQQLMGVGHGHAHPVDLLNDSFARGGEGETYETQDKSPLDLNFRQGLSNLDARARIEHLLADDYIGHHPVQDVAAAYNRAVHTNPNIGDTEMTQLIRQDLASGGSVPLDTLLNVSSRK